MGRGRGKGKKHTVIAAKDDPGHGEEEKLPASKRRGRPLKDQVEEADKVESDENAKSSATSKDSAVDKGRKRKRPAKVTDDPDPVNEENDSGAKHSSDSSGNLIKSVGFRPNGSRRKNKPCRAAEVGVECK